MIYFKLLITILFCNINESQTKFLKQLDNVLMLVVDDLLSVLGTERGRGETKCAGAHAQIHIPNIKSFAGKSYIFQNAFAQQALCAPSRNSLLTGRRPDTLHLYDFYSYWRNSAGNFTTLPQYFKDNGYRTYSFGKVFHPGISSNFTDDYPYSWSEPPYHPSTEIYKQAKVCMDEDTGKLARNLVCPVVLEYQPEKTLPDIQTTNAAIFKLKEHKEIFQDVPFFMAIGFHKPHIPLKFPMQYLDYYPINNISLPKQPFRPSLMPEVAWNPWTDVRSRDDIKKLNISFPYGKIPDEWILKITQSYYASVTYIDDLIGKILKEINMKNTIIILTSDHGWSLGEHGEWSKFSNFDVALKVPLIVHSPRLNIGDNPHYLNEIVELVDIFPTLAELSEITDEFPQCRNGFIEEILCSEGHTLMPLLLKKPMVKWKNIAFSQFPRPGLSPTWHPNSDKPRLKDIKIMGYTLRTKRFRYTEWVKFDNVNFKPNWDSVFAVELYDHLIDDGENLNLADRAELKDLRKKLSNQLRKGWRKN